MRKVYKTFSRQPIRPLRRKCMLLRRGERVIVQNTYLSSLGNFPSDYVARKLRKTIIMSKTIKIDGEPEYEYRRV